MASKVTCSNCGWSWNKSDSSNKDMYVCHQCGRDNSNKSEGWLDKYEEGGQVDKYKTLPEVVVKSKKKVKDLPNVTVSSKSKKSSPIKLATESTAIQMYDPITNRNKSTANPGQTKSQLKQSTSNIKPQSLKDIAKDITAFTQFFPHPIVSVPSMMINSGIGINDALENEKKKQYENEVINTLGALPWGKIVPGWKGKVLEVVSAISDLTNNFGLEQQKNGGWLDKYEQGGMVLKQKTEDNYGKKPNVNNVQVSTPPGFVGMGSNIEGRDYSPAWGGQFEDGGDIPQAQDGLWSTNKKAYVDSALNANKNLDWVKRLYDSNLKSTMVPGEKSPSTHRMGDNDQGYVFPTIVNMNGQLVDLGDRAEDYARETNTGIQFPKEQGTWFARSTDDKSGYKMGTGVLKGKPVMQKYKSVDKKAMGGNIPGSVGFTYARTGNIPSNGKYAKKTLASAQNGQEMSYYQHGLDFKTKGMKNGGWLDAYDVPQAQDGESFFKAPDVPGYAQGRDVLTPQQLIDIKKYQDDRSQEIVDQIRNKKSTLKQGQKETKKEAEYRTRKNEQFQQSHPYSNIDDQGTLSRSQSDRTMEGLPEAHSRAYYNDQALDKAMTSLDAAGYITGAGELLGAAAPIMKEAVKEAVKDAGRFLTEETVLKNAYKLNPYAFKPNESNWYRQIGDAGYQDAIKTGMIRGANEDLSKSMLNKIDEPYFSKGEPFFSAFDIKPTGIQSDKFLLEGNLSANDIIPAAGDNRWIDHMNNLSEKGLLENMDFGILQKDPALRNLENFNIYKKDWLKGYKEVPKPSTSISSSVENVGNDVMDFNKDFGVDRMEYFSEYDKGLGASKKFIDNLQDVFENLKSKHKEEFEKLYGTDYNEKDLLNYAKKKEQYFNPSETPLSSEKFSRLNNEFVEKFNPADIESIDEKNALQAYTSGSYRGFNFRPNTDPNKTVLSLSGEHNPTFYKNEMSPSLQSAILKNKLNQDLALYRGIGDESVISKVWRNNEPLENIKFKDLIEGDEMLHEPFVSTSLFPNPHFGGFSSGTARIVAPKGQSYAFANKQGLSYTPSELELTLPQNLRFKITKKHDADKAFSLGYGVEQEIVNPYKEGGVVKDDMGYWNPDNHGKVVEIGSNDITMEGVDQPLIGISDEGDKKYMLPGKNYKFKGKKVREYPVAKNGLRQEQKGLQNLDQLTNFTNYNKPQPGGWLNKYN